MRVSLKTNVPPSTATLPIRAFNPPPPRRRNPGGRLSVPSGKMVRCSRGREREIEPIVSVRPISVTRPPTTASVASKKGAVSPGAPPTRMPFTAIPGGRKETESESKDTGRSRAAEAVRTIHARVARWNLSER